MADAYLLLFTILFISFCLTFVLQWGTSDQEPGADQPLLSIKSPKTHFKCHPQAKIPDTNNVLVQPYWPIVVWNSSKFPSIAATMKLGIVREAIGLDLQFVSCCFPVSDLRTMQDWFPDCNSLTWNIVY